MILWKFYFNPRSREGSDDAQVVALRLHGLFQSTLPRGERRQIRCSPKRDCNFNPRSREGSDITTRPDIRRHPDFNPRSREGSDIYLISSPCPLADNFNPRSREGSDGDNITFSWLLEEFQSTLPRGERLRRHWQAEGLTDFNPRSREGSDSNFSQKSISIFSRNQQIIILYT